MKKESARKLFIAVIAIIGWFALVLQLYIMLKNGPAAGIRPFTTVVNFISYFTILCNLLVAISLSYSLLAPSSNAGKLFLNPVNQSAICLYIVIVGLVYSIALRQIWDPKGLQLLADRLLHDAIPLLYLIFWIIFIPRGVLNWKNVFPWMTLPAIYIVYSLIRGAVMGWYPYPFIHVEELGYGKVIVNALLMGLAFLGIGLIMIAFNRMSRRR